MFMEQLIMGFGTPKKLTPLLCVSVMQIGLATLMIEKVLVEDVSILEKIWCHGTARNKTRSPSPLLRPNTLLLEVVVLNSYG